MPQSDDCGVTLLCFIAISVDAGQDFTSQRPTIPTTGWTAITPRIVTGSLVNRTTTHGSALVSVTAGLPTAIALVATDYATSAKVFISC